MVQVVAAQYKLNMTILAGPSGNMPIMTRLEFCRKNFPIFFSHENSLYAQQFHPPLLEAAARCVRASEVKFYLILEVI